MKRTETIAEFLARGGKIIKILPGEHKHKPDNIKSNSAGGPAIIMSMDEADLYYGEQKNKKAKKIRNTNTIDISALPEELRKKYVDEVVHAAQENEDDGE